MLVDTDVVSFFYKKDTRARAHDLTIRNPKSEISNQDVPGLTLISENVRQ